MVGVGNPPGTGVDTDEGSVVCGGVTSHDEVSNKVIDSHDDCRVVNF
jgi:hypothetical protein